MRQPVLTIFYQFNPWHSTVGGIQTVIVNFIKYAPDNFSVRLVGTAVDKDQSIGEWTKAKLAGREILFLPLLRVKDDNVRGLVPTTLRYTLALLKHNLASDFMHFHRLEPTLATWHWPGDKTLFVHNDVQQQMEPSSSNQDAILWRRCPSAYFALERLLLSQMSQILTCNSNSLEFYKTCYPAIEQRIQFIKNTVDTEIFYPLDCQKREIKRHDFAKRLGLSENTRFLLFAGRLHPQKNPILLLQALANLNDPQTHLLIAGDGELATEVKATISKLCLSSQITMLGALSQGELADLYRICSVFVLTSLYEGLPMTVLEALACGVPVVTTRCGETPSLLSPNSGVVCAEHTPNAIAAALHKVLMNPGDYPALACTQAAKPYWAKTVIADIYKEMWQQWRKKQRGKLNESPQPEISMS